jgi:hypothetical protein
MLNKFQIFDKENLLFDFIFESVDKIIRNKPNVKERYIKILSCYFGPGNFEFKGIEISTLEKFKEECLKRQIVLELILSKRIFRQNEGFLDHNEYFKSFPNKKEATLFHGKSICYVHGKLNSTIKNEEIMVSINSTADGFLLLTSANFSKAYFGSNYETGVLTNNKVTLRTFLNEFENCKGTRRQDKIPVYSLFDIFAEGYILTTGSSPTLDTLTCFKLHRINNVQPDQIIANLGGSSFSAGELSFSLEKAKLFNINEFEKKFPRPIKEFRKFTLSTPYGTWIPKSLYEEICNLYSTLLDSYKNALNNAFCNDTFDNTIINWWLKFAETIPQLNVEEEEHIILELMYEMKDNLTKSINDDSILKSMFFGHGFSPFPLDPNNEYVLKEFFEKTKLNNKRKARKPRKENIIDVLMPYLENNDVNYDESSEKINNLKKHIRNDFERKKNNIVELNSIINNIN